MSLFRSRRVFPSFCARAPAIAACLLAAACGALPQPFSREGKVDNPLVAPKARAGIKVLPVAGMPRGGALAEEVAAAFRREDIAAQAGHGPSSGYALMGRAVTRPGPVPSRTRVGILWRVLGPDGSAAGIHLQELIVERSDWREGTQPLLRRLARAAVAEIAPGIADPKRGQAAAKRTVAVRDVTGAPGDGRVSLRRSLAFELRKLGFPVTESNETVADALVVSGTVKVTGAAKGEDQIAIAWTVSGPKGGILGTVKQANTVKAGSLRASWGVTAAFAARAAAPGIARILRRGPTASGP